MLKVRYSHNNSGGQWWLNDADWSALEANGWTVNWYADRESGLSMVDEDGRFLGALAGDAEVEISTPDDFEDKIWEWASITGEDPMALGCYSCCGPPHSFTLEGEYNGKDVWEYRSPSPSGSSW